MESMDAILSRLEIDDLEGSILIELSDPNHKL